jgi:Uma2 family endonuclease
MVVLRAEMVPRTRADAVESIPRRRFTVAEYHRMAEAGVLTEDDRVELLDGVIVRMSPIGRPHSSTVARLHTLLVRRFSRYATVWGQNPIVLDRWSEPQPDLCLLASKADFYLSADVRPRDVLLAIEVMASSRSYDRSLKLPLYAKAELREVWLVDVRAQTVNVHRRPALRGYREQHTYGRGEAIVPLAFPRLRIRVNEILG